MQQFLLGVGSSVAAAAIIWSLVAFVLPYIQDHWLYGGVRVEGVWEIFHVKADGMPVDESVGKLKLHQRGSRIDGKSNRTMTRAGEPSDREFDYKGRIAGDQMTLLYEDAKGRDFDSGTYVFRLHTDGVTMVGMATFNGRPENRIVSEPRLLKKTAESLTSG